MRPKTAERNTMGKQIWYPIDARNFGCDVSVRPSVRTDSRGGGGESQGNPTGLESAIVSWREISRCFWQPAFFFAGNRMTIVAFEKEVSLKA